MESARAIRVESLATGYHSAQFLGASNTQAFKFDIFNCFIYLLLDNPNELFKSNTFTKIIHSYTEPLTIKSPPWVGATYQYIPQCLTLPPHFYQQHKATPT